MSEYVSDIAFTPSVKAEQEKRGSRTSYSKMAAKRDWRTTVTADLKAFLAERDSFYLATATKDGQPYIQHRGGPKGFLHVLDDRTLAFADFKGNRQYISLGNVVENDRAHMFLMDYANRKRVKIWGRIRIVEDDAELLARVAPGGCDARAERVFVFAITAWDPNCPQHIVPRYDEETVREATGNLIRQLATLREENARLRAQLAAIAS